MKMVCPQCGVKGSADEALLGRKVKCPKCTAIFEIGAEVVETIEIDELELEQVEEPAELEDDVASEDEVDQVLSSLLTGENGRLDEKMATTDTPGDSLTIPETFPGEDELVAALSDLNETAAETEELQTEEDDTLTIIEDFPEEALTDSTERNAEEKELALDDFGDTPPEEPTLPASEQEQDQRDESPASEAIEKSLDFEDGFFDEEVIAKTEKEEGDEDLGDLPEELFDTAEKEELLTESEAEPEAVAEIVDPTEEERQQKDEPETTAMPPDDEVMLAASFLDDDLDAKLAADEQENEDGIDDGAVAMIQKCSACDRYVDPKTKYEHNGNAYCAKCIPADLSEEERQARQHDAVPLQQEEPEDEETEIITAQPTDDFKETYVPGRFTIITLIKDSWTYAKGAKASLWGAILFMYIVLIGLGVGYTLVSMKFLPSTDRLTAMLIDGGVQALLSFLSYVFVAGILLIGINRIGQKPYSWKLVFSGFERFGAMAGLFILQTIMLIIGFLLFVLPGIYLSVGYVLAIPLLFMKRLSPWQALEASRKAIHARWWTVFFAFIVMTILVSLSTIPLGLGLIWTVPMLVVMIGVLYYLFFGADEEEEEDQEDKEDEEAVEEENEEMA